MRLGQWRWLVGVGVVSVSAVLAAGCSCTEAACSDVVSLEIHGVDAIAGGALPVQIEVCMGAQCVPVTIESEEECTVSGSGFDSCEMTGGTLTVSVNGAPEQSSIDVEISGPSGETLYSGSVGVQKLEFQPNGPQCEPTCQSTRAEVTLTSS